MEALFDYFLMFSSGCLFYWWCYPLVSTGLTIIPTVTHDNPYFNEIPEELMAFSTIKWKSNLNNSGGTDNLF